MGGLTLPKILSSYKRQAFLEKVVAIFDGQLGSMQLRAMMMMKISIFSSWHPEMFGRVLRFEKVSCFDRKICCFGYIRAFFKMTPLFKREI